MPKIYECLFLCSFLSICWLSKQAVHEYGHVAGAFATGGEVERVVLHSLTISRTGISKNPLPLAVAWAGPIWGAMLPLLLLAVINRERILLRAMTRFFIGFCLHANELYIGLGSLGRVGDAGDLLRHGASLGTLCLFGSTATIAGILFWHQLGPLMGWRANSTIVKPKIAYSMTGILLVRILVFCLFSGRH